MLRNILLIAFAVLIDFLQAAISAALFAIGAFAGTIGGAAAGCYWGAKVGGTLGCTVVGGLGGFFGSFANPLIAGGTITIAVVMGFAINFCLDATLGTILIMWLLWEDMYYPRFGISGFIAELIPGVNDLPAWTIMTVLSIMRKSAEEGKLKSPAGGVFKKIMTTGAIGAAATATSVLLQRNQQTARDSGVITKEQQDEVRKNKIQSVALNLEL